MFKMFCLKTSIFCMVLYIHFCCSHYQGHEPRIAIIGGGVGGTTAAYELTQLCVKEGLEFTLDLFEPANVGGRLATSFVNNFEFETGGSIIHDKNMYMRLYAERFNLSEYTNPDESVKTDLVGFYDGQEFVYHQSRYELLSLLKLWWRYGLNMKRLTDQLIGPLLSHFKRIYELQINQETFDDIQSFLHALDPSFPKLLTTSIDHLLSSKGFSYRFIREFVFIATNVNYNQDTDIHGFVGAVALAGAQESLWSVQGGNKQIPEALLDHSDAYLIKERVEAIKLMPDLRYALYVGDYIHLYDYVIIACPLIENPKRIIFEGFRKPVVVEPVKYQKTVVTLVHGILNHTFFNYESLQNLPNHIYSVSMNLFFNSITVVDPVKPDTSYDRRVFKVFSKNVLTNEQLDSLFLCHDNVTTVDWLAYPLYDTEQMNLKFVLHDNLFYVNSIEWTASAMEMSAVSGINAALHVLKNMKARHFLQNVNPN